MSDNNHDDPDLPPGRNPVGAALAAVADKWLVLVVHALHHGSARHGELMGRIEGVSHPTLTRTLRYLETAGLVTRTAYPEVPPRVEYALTDRGQSLAVPVSALAAWAEANIDAFVPSREPEGE